jgi:hypothetical protein
MKNKKPVKAEKFSKLKLGKNYLFTTVCYEQVGKSTWRVYESEPVKGKLLSLTTKRVEIIEDEKPTGTFPYLFIADSSK